MKYETALTKEKYFSSIRQWHNNVFDCSYTEKLLTKTALKLTFPFLRIPDQLL